MRRDLGDFQTPPALVDEVIESLATGRATGPWRRVLEPTCGCGSFVRGILKLSVAPCEIQGIELQEEHVARARQIEQPENSVSIVIHHADLFRMNLRRDLTWKCDGPMLVIGNPPWVTNSEIGATGGGNLPKKTNIKCVRGIEALTGSSNFDIAEHIWIKLLCELGNERPTIALLCKTSVARNVMEYAGRNRFPVTDSSIHRIDAKKWFGASVDACLLTVRLGEGPPRYEATVYPNLQSFEPQGVLGFVEGQLVADVGRYRTLSHLSGSSIVTWRQGLKHDAAAVMELTPVPGGYQNRIGDVIQLEEEYVYPLLKSSDLRHSSYRLPRSRVIVTQRHLADSTLHLKHAAPRLWAYLTGYAELFRKRRSSIYQGRPPFAMFGIGSYAFSPYKVAISGLHKSFVFRAIGPVLGRPVMLDDTCYYIACNTPEQAALLTSAFNDPLSCAFLESLTFWDAKRPITKRLLQRLDVMELIRCIDPLQLVKRVEAELAVLAKQEDSSVVLPAASLAECLLSLTGEGQTDQLDLGIL